MRTIVYSLAFLLCLKETAVAQSRTLQLSASPAARQEFMRAWDEGNRGLLQRAADHADRALSIDSAFGLARILRSRLAPGSPNTQNRLDDMNRGLADAMRGSRAEAYLARAIVSLYSAAGANMFPSVSSPDPGRLAGNALRTRDMARAAAREAVDSAMLAAPDDPYIAYFSAALVDESSFDQRLEQVARQFPSFPVVRYTIAMRRLRTGDNEGGERVLLEYIRLAPNTAHAHHAYAAFLVDRQRAVESLDHAMRALELDSLSAVHWEAAARAQAQLSDHEAAIRSARRAVELDPAGGRGEFLADVMIKAGLVDSAVAMARARVAADPSSVAANAGFVWVLIRAYRYNDAIEVLNEQAARATAPIYRQPLLAAIAMVHILSGRPGSAIEQIQFIMDESRRVDTRSNTHAQLRTIAMIQAASGDCSNARNSVSGANELTALLVAGQPAVAAANVAPVYRANAIVLAMCGAIAEARLAAGEFDSAARTLGDLERSQLREVHSVIATAAGDTALARRELEAAGPTAILGRAFYAERLARSGRTQDASALMQQVLEAPLPTQITPYVAIARAKARAFVPRTG